MEFHQPVLVDEVLELLQVTPKKIYIDATVGNGGHSLEILKMGGVVFGLDQDPLNLNIATNRIHHQGFTDTFHPINSNFTKLIDVANNIPQHIDGILFDLGLSSGQLKSPGRGFSFNDPNSLDMRLDPNTQALTAEEIINTYSFEQLYDIFTKLAQETFSKPLIIRIISERQQSPIRSGTRLAQIIKDYYTSKHIRTHVDPSTKIFMALRITVNQEFDNLKEVLNSTLTPKLTNCNICVISFHSGEDRIVKQFIRQNSLQKKVQNLTPKAILPSSIEIKKNPLSRSAVLRSYKIV